VIGYGITPKVSKSKYKIRYYFMGSTYAAKRSIWDQCKKK